MIGENVDDVLGMILAIPLDDDIRRFRDALARAFPITVDAAGKKVVAYVPPSYAMQPLDGGGIPATGALASIPAPPSLLVPAAGAVAASRSNASAQDAATVAG